MKKIIVLAMLYLSYSIQVLSSQDDSVVILALTGISCLALKAAAKRWNECAIQKITFPETKNFDCLVSNRSSFSSVLSTLSIASPDESSSLESLRSTPVSDKFTSLRGLIYAKRDTVYIPHRNTPISVVNKDQCEHSCLGDEITTQVPSWFVKQPVISFLPVEQECFAHVVLDEYVNVAAISPVSDRDLEYEIVESLK